MPDMFCVITVQALLHWCKLYCVVSRHNCRINSLTDGITWKGKASAEERETCLVLDISEVLCQGTVFKLTPSELF